MRKVWCVVCQLTKEVIYIPFEYVDGIGGNQGHQQKKDGDESDRVAIKIGLECSPCSKGRLYCMGIPVWRLLSSRRSFRGKG